MFWPNYYRNIEFTGLIYMINYDNKDTLNESVRIMHDLLSEEELQDVHVLIVANIAKTDKKKNDNEDSHIELKKKIDGDDDDMGDDNEENPETVSLIEEIKKNIYYDLLTQISKEIFILDLFDENLSAPEQSRTSKALRKFISDFD
jgi:hypothetical protein